MRSAGHSSGQRSGIATSSGHAAGGFNLGGEQSGHLVSSITRHGDGIVAALQVLAIMVRSGRPLSELSRAAMQRVPQVLENVTLRRDASFRMPLLATATAKVTRSLGKDGRVLVRWSGTEPKLRVMIEGPDEARIGASHTTWCKPRGRTSPPPCDARCATPGARAGEGGESSRSVGSGDQYGLAHGLRLFHRHE